MQQTITIRQSSGFDWKFFNKFFEETKAVVLRQEDVYPKYIVGEWNSDDQKGHILVTVESATDFVQWRKQNVQRLYVQY